MTRSAISICRSNSERQRLNWYPSLVSVKKTVSPTLRLRRESTSSGRTTPAESPIVWISSLIIGQLDSIEEWRWVGGRVVSEICVERFVGVKAESDSLRGESAQASEF